MLGILLTISSTLFGETSNVIGKAKVLKHQESVYTMGFLNVCWVTLAFFCIAIVVPGSFVFSAVALPTYGLRMILEVVQAHVTVRAITVSSRSAFGFLRIITIPLLLITDIVIGYDLHTFQLIGMGVIIVALAFLLLNHGVERKGAGLVLFSAVNAVATISLYKYHISHFNSVIGEQLPILIVLALYFFITARVCAKENPLQYLRQPVYLLQSAGNGIAAGLGSFAMLFAPASVILTAKRSSSILWSILSGNIYFHERHFIVKLIGFVILACGLILLAF
ncbi:MAG: hypothetical protein ABIG71_01510 [Candidatus Uhrbacteria bacterium]